MLKVLVVDDSAFFRHRIADVIDAAPDMEIIGYAVNGDEALQQTHQLKPDIITMDVQMPVVDGITAVRRIMQSSPTRILMFSALTNEGARETLQALEAGAVDFLPKSNGSSGGDFTAAQTQDLLLSRIRTVAKSRLPKMPHLGSGLKTLAAVHKLKPAGSEVHAEPIKLVAIGASTGGPVALQGILSSLPRDFSLPLVVAVHMPGSFTQAYAERLNTLCAIEVKEATDRDLLRPGRALIAPGGKQTLIEQSASGPMVRVKQALPADVYHPSVDQLFDSVARALGSQALGLVLTGMGSDGLEGGRRLRAAGGRLWSQDEKSCVVYGMPHAVERAGLCERILPLNEIGRQLVKMT